MKPHMRLLYFNETECLLHRVMHQYFNTGTEGYLMFGVLLCEWSDKNTLRIINSGFPPALTHRWQ